jgi:uncharacterized protein (TIGR03435 family)
MVRQITASSIAWLGWTAIVFTQAAPSQPAFEVASVRRLPAETPGGRNIVVRPGRLTGQALTVRELVAVAHGMLDHQITGGPDWIGDDRYEILATMTADATNAEARGMLRSLLADRFAFVAHTEMQELPAYLLRMQNDAGRPGPQLRQSGAQCAPMSRPPEAAAPPAFVPAPPPPGEGREVTALDETPGRCPSVMARFNGIAHWSVRETTIQAFAGRLTMELRRAVVDRTGLEGAYDLDLTFTSDAAALVSTITGAVPVLPTALREQLGLQLESARVPVEVLVIDRVERPTGN